MPVTGSIDTSGTQKALRSFRWPVRASQAVARASERLARRTSPVRSGRLKRALRGEGDADGVTIKGTDYLEYVERRKPFVRDAVSQALSRESEDIGEAIFDELKN